MRQINKIMGRASVPHPTGAKKSRSSGKKYKNGKWASYQEQIGQYGDEILPNDTKVDFTRLDLSGCMRRVAGAGNAYF
jgi:hypothetical protein